MSNVLIGIIGVILFIGLALAGALFLGPRFQESTNNSKASAAVQAVSQVASAANMYNVQEGAVVQTGTVSTTHPLVANQYLKSVPGNPLVAANAPAITVVGTAPNDVTYVYMNLGDNSAVCTAIARQSGQTLVGTGTAATAPVAVDGRPSGCFKPAAAGSNATAFARI